MTLNSCFPIAYNLTISSLGSVTSSATNYIIANPGTLTQYVANSLVTFPIGLASSDYTPISFSTSGTAQNYSVRVQSVTAPLLATDGTNGIARQWVVYAGTPLFSGITAAWNATANGNLAAAPSTCDLVCNTSGLNKPYDVLQTGLSYSAYSVTTSTFLNQPGDITGGLYISLVQSNAALPVELSTFTSNLNGRTVQLNWETKTEKNSNKFEIQRSLTSDNNWASLGSVKAADLSSSIKQYSYADKNLQAGTYQYRLKMIDNDGTYEYSKVLETVITLPKNFELNQNYPNPFNPSTKISYSLPNDSKVTLDIFNLIGERIGQLVSQDQAAGYYSVDFSNASVNKSLSSGVYLYRIHAVDKSTGKDFSSIKKMVLLK